MVLASCLEDHLMLSDFSIRERDKILVKVMMFLLGTAKYGETTSDLKQYKINKNFSHMLRKFKEKETRYILKIIRRKALGLLTFLPKDDELLLRGVSKKIDLLEVNMVEYPLEQESLNSLMSVIGASARSSYATLKGDCALSRMDIISELMIKAIETYRTYIYTYGSFNFNNDVFFSCMIRAIKSKNLDIIDNQNAKKRRANANCVPLTDEVALDTRVWKVLSMSDYGVPIRVNRYL